ncbi:MAG: hypothetical protein LQ338_000115 [Usnochroma carphineum]|nr:MAG: hypothetical protein LQ338_000115 [Usnochroma carphineum]
MPIFQDPDQRFFNVLVPSEPSSRQPIKAKSSEESIPTEFCDGPLPDAPPWETVEKEDDAPEEKEQSCSRGGVCTSDRNELMERIKRGESPTWIPSQTLREEYSKTNHQRFPSPSTKPANHEPTPLPPTTDTEFSGHSQNGPHAAELSPPSEIKRPRSALHAGDFNNKDSQDVPAALQKIPVTDQPKSPTVHVAGVSSTTPWYSPDQPPHYAQLPYSSQGLSAPQRPGLVPLRSRAPSLNSHSSSFVAKAPTTPLVQQSNSTDLDFCPIDLSATVFYSWTGGAGRKHTNVDDEPSPYVGHIDLQHLPTPAESRKARRSRSKSPPDAASPTPIRNDSVRKGVDSRERTVRAYKKQRRASPGPPDLQGGYRIPQKGQLQIVIKNPNKTAVKLFLLPYDLEDMKAGTKTFIRQRCYSTDPVIEGMPSKYTSEPNSSTPGASARSKPTLRYLIHVNICSPSTGRFYLYQHIRVVFANRVPDNKEQLQTEIQVPQPRYSAFNLNSSLSRSVSSSGAGLAREKAHRRRSSGFDVGYEETDDRHPHGFGSGTSYTFMFDSSPSQIPPVPRLPSHLTGTPAADPEAESPMDVTHSFGNIPFAGMDDASSALPIHAGPSLSPAPATPIYRLPIARQRPENRGPAGSEAMDIDTSTSRFSHMPLSNKTNRPSSRSSGENSGTYSKLSKGDAGYGGRPSTLERGEGLLARKLRGLGVWREMNGKDAGGP